MAQILTLLAVSVLLVWIFRRLHLPPLLGYLFVGVVLGPHALGWFDNQGAAHLLGEIGVALRTGTVLGHGGEFGLALLALALSTGLLDSAGSQPILASILTMLAAPLMIRYNGQVAEWLLPTTPAPDVQTGVPARPWPGRYSARRPSGSARCARTSASKSAAGTGGLTR